MIGTHRNMPTTPHIVPHTISETITTSGERLSVLPMMAGSTTFAVTTWMVPNTSSTIRKGVRLSNCTSVRMAGARMARIEPTVGI